jgi:hypothetical protein
MISNNRTSLLVSSQLPEFVRNDHPQFVTFLEKYYEFMEQETGATNQAKIFNDNLNIDLANAQFEKKLYDNYLKLIPKDIIADKKIILKAVKDFYRSRGSEKSLRFLLNIITPKIFIPTSQNTNIIRVKGVYYNNVANSLALSTYVGKTIRGIDSEASANVQSVKSYFDNGVKVNELIVVSVNGRFDPGENVVAFYRENGSYQRIESTLFTGEVESIVVNERFRGSGYRVNTFVNIQSPSGSNANAYISKVTVGNVNNIVVTFSGAGFKTGDFLSFTSGSGLGANAYVFMVSADNKYHPNSYMMISSRINEEANTRISNTKYSNLSSTITDPANTALINVAKTFAYSNVGPVEIVYVANGGSQYVELPTVDISSNTIARALGIAARMEIIDGGLNYAVGDIVRFINVLGGYGFTANANVTSTAANGMITEVKFVPVAGEHTGGAGWATGYYPTLSVDSSTGNGANIILRTTLADGEVLQISNTLIGAIEQFTIVNPGENYLTVPTIDLTNQGDGTAEAIATVRSGVIQWPSRFVANAGFFTAERDAEVYYPKNDVLRASDGKWYVEKTLRIKNTQISNSSNSLYEALEKFKNTLVRGRTSNATAVIEKVNRFYESTTLVDELVISSKKGDFRNGEQIFTFFTEEGQSKYISAELFNGALNTVRITNSGSRYNIGDIVTVTSNTGANANVVISKVSAGNIKSVVVIYSGAGFQVNDYITFASSTGSNANAKVIAVLSNGTVHPNTYNVVGTTIDFEANTVIGNSRYANLSSSIGDPANVAIKNLMSFFAYSNTGPALSIYVVEPGRDYLPPISPNIKANTRINNLGTIGRIEVIDGGELYQANDKIVFKNVPGGYGYGGRANVTNVDITGAITQVRFEYYGSSEKPGGEGWEMDYLPVADINTTYGFGANVVIKCILGDGEELLVSNSSIGAIEELSILNRGDGYVTAPTLDLSNIGDGTAQASATIIEGAYSYPGRYLNDDGQVSSSNYLQNKDYYQNFSYVVKSKESIDNYIKQVNDTVHPSGTKIFGEYLYEDSGEIESSDTTVYDASIITYSQAVGVLDNIYVTTAGALYKIGDPAVIVSNTGANGIAIVSQVISGNVNNITVTFSGAGFQVNDYITFANTDAIARVSQVNRTGSYHPNSYPMYFTTINVEANTPINNTTYANANSAVSDPANTAFRNVIPTTTYSNTGPATVIAVLSAGNTTNLIPSLDINSNTYVRSLGIFGRLEIDAAGRGYANGDVITLTNKVGSYGYGTNAYISSVNANGAIIAVYFGNTAGEHRGGAGWDQNNLPTATITSANGTGAIITPRATLGDGEILAISNSSIGGIQKITILNRGDGYITAPSIDLTGSGNGLANAYATIITNIEEIEDVV